MGEIELAVRFVRETAPLDFLHVYSAIIAVDISSHLERYNGEDRGRTIGTV